MESAEDGGGVSCWFAQGFARACRTTSVSDVGTRSMPGVSADKALRKEGKQSMNDKEIDRHLKKKQTYSKHWFLALEVCNHIEIHVY